MHKLVEQLASLLYIYTMNFINLAEEHEVGTEDDLNGKADCVLVDS